MSNLTVIQESLEKDLVAAGVQSVLPAHIKMEAFVRCGAVALTKNKDLGECQQESVIMSLTQCATDGLVPDGKEAALVAYNTNIGTKQQPNYVKKAQYLPMIDGILKRARMSGQIDAMTAKAVFENDEFDYWLDEAGEHIKYRPTYGERGAFKLAFAYARLKTGDLVVEVMSKEDIDKVRSASKTGKYGPWADWYDRMACKTVFHRLARRLPNASEIVEMCEAGMNMKFEKDMGQAELATTKAQETQQMLNGLTATEAFVDEAEAVVDAEVNYVEFMKQSIDSCSDVESLKQCGNDIKDLIDEGKINEAETTEIRDYLNNVMKAEKAKAKG